MNNSTKKYIVPGLFFSLILLGCTEKKASPDILPDVKFSSAEIQLTEFSENKKNLGGPVGINLQRDGKEFLKVKTTSDVSPEKAKEVLALKTSETRMMFAPQQVPYVGQVSKDINCVQAVEVDKPVTDTATELSVYFNLTATERFIYGSCIPEQETFKSQFLLLYCKKSRALHEIKYFYSGKETYRKQIAVCAE